jgi:predicted esterase
MPIDARRMWVSVRACGVVTLGLLSATSGHAAPPEQPPGRYAAVKDEERVPGQPFERYFTTDGLGRLITFYLSESKAENTEARPLMVWVQGSGSQSNFAEREGRVVPTNGFATLLDAATGRARVMIVEKPGVKYLEQPSRPGSASEGSEEFKKEHTLETWSEGVGAGMKAALTLPGVDASRVLLGGHSEGGLVACRVAAGNDIVTHVASLAGGGPTQLFDLVELVRQGCFYERASDDPEARAAMVLEGWENVRAEPESWQKTWMGHPNRRWASFLASSPMEELLKTDARVFIAQGTADRAVSVGSFDALRAQLVAKGRDVTADRVEGADHSFSVEGDGRGDGWSRELAKVVEWFLEEKQ